VNIVRTLRFYSALLLGIALVLVAVDSALTQQQQKGGKGGFGGGGPGGGGFGGGGPGGGGRGGRGGPGGNFSPDAFFDRLANGADFIAIDAMMPMFKPQALEFAQKKGITNGQLTRAQFGEMMQERMAQRGQNGGGPPNAVGAAPAGPGGPGGGPPDPNTFFNMLSKGADTVVIADIQDGGARNRLSDYAAKKGITNGQITRDQFADYMKERMAAGNQGGGRGNQNQNPGIIWGDSDDDEPTKAPVYRPGKFPKELPEWFAQLDTDKDGMVGLYEWKQSGRTVADFRNIDRNGDGFVTVEEVLRSVKKTTGEGSGTDVASNSTGLAGAGPTDGGDVINPPGRGGPGNRGQNRPGRNGAGNGGGAPGAGPGAAPGGGPGGRNRGGDGAGQGGGRGNRGGGGAGGRGGRGGPQTQP
jgi:hypothetical protein